MRNTRSGPPERERAGRRQPERGRPRYGPGHARPGCGRPGHRRFAAGCLALAVLAGAPPPASAQGARTTATVVGRVLTEAGDPIVAAEVALLREGARTAATGTSPAGAFRLVTPRGSYVVRASALGYRPTERALDLGPGAVVEIEIRLTAQAVSVGEIRVQRERARFEEVAGVTVAELSVSDVRRLPGLAEADVLRAVEVLPGVVSTSDFSAAFNVRGGAADQNLILLDGAPIYNPFHLGGIFGVFNSDMVERAELMAGGFPARYGGRVSSVLDVRSDAGDGTFGVDAGVSLLASRVAVGGGIPDELAERVGLGSVRARVSARRSYLDALLAPVFDFPYHLTDVQGIARAWTGTGLWTVTAYTGEDVLDLRSAEDFPLRLRLDWGNDVLGTRWAGRLGGLDIDARASYSAFGTAVRFSDFDDSEFRSAIHDARASLDVSIPAGAATFGLGAEAARIDYDNLAATGGTVFRAAADRGWLGAAYGQLRWEPTDWRIELGARLDVWDPESADASVEPAPRLSIKRFLDDRNAALDLSLGRYTQALHSLRDEEAPIGIDLWVTAGERAPVVVSDQVQLGYERFWDGWQGSIEAYYRTFDGVVTTSPADDLNDPTDDLIRGTGTSYGLDLLLRRDAAAGAIDGWVAVSLLRARRTFPDLLSPDSASVTYAPIYDRRVDIDLVLRFPLPADIEGGLRLNFGSGLPYTRPVAAYPYYAYDLQTGRWRPETGEDDDGRRELQTAVALGDRNAVRYPHYHRLDISFRRTVTRNWGRYTPFLNLLNVYNRKNVLFYFFEYDREPPVRTGISMLPVVPTLGVEVSF